MQLLIVIAVLFLGGCSMFRLTENTVDVSGTIDVIYTRQALSNLSKFIDQPNAIPSQVDLTAGTVQTSNSITPSVSGPLSNATTKNSTGLVQTVRAAVNLNVNASDAWQQNWNVAPVTDANTLRNLRLLYRYVIDPTFSDDEFIHDYLIARKASGQGFEDNPYYYLEPHCVVCREGRGKRINKRLKRGWLYWSGGPGGDRLPPQGEETVLLGHYGSYDLYMLKHDFQAGVLSDFILFLLPQTEPASQERERGGGGNRERSPRTPGRGGVPLIPQATPPGIQPQVQ